MIYVSETLEKEIVGMPVRDLMQSYFTDLHLSVHSFHAVGGAFFALKRTLLTVFRVAKVARTALLMQGT